MRIKGVGDGARDGLAHRAPPGAAQHGAERCCPRSVAADIADHEGHGAVSEGDEIEEVAAQAEAVLAGQVVGGDGQERMREHAGQQQTLLEAAVELVAPCLGPQPRRQQLAHPARADGDEHHQGDPQERARDDRRRMGVLAEVGDERSVGQRPHGDNREARQRAGEDADRGRDGHAQRPGQADDAAGGHEAEDEHHRDLEEHADDHAAHSLRARLRAFDKRLEEAGRGRVSRSAHVGLLSHAPQVRRRCLLSEVMPDEVRAQSQRQPEAFGR